MGRKEKGVTTAAANTCTTNKQTRATRTTRNVPTENCSDTKQQKNDPKTTKASKSDAEIVPDSHSDKTKEDTIQPQPVIKTYKSKKAINESLSLTKSQPNAVSVPEPASCRISQSDINQRPRRQIKHKFIKTTRNVPQIEILPIPTEPTKLAIESKVQNEKAISSSSNADIAKIDNSLEISLKNTSKKSKESKNLRRSNRQSNRFADLTDDEQHQNIESNQENPISDDNVQLIEIVDTCDNHGICEEIVETTISTGEDTDEPYEFYNVIDENEVVVSDQIHVPKSASNADTPYSVTVEDTSSNSQFSQNSSGSAKKMYVEISDSLSNQQAIEVVTAIDSDSQASGSVVIVAESESTKRQSFSGAFNNSARRKSKRLGQSKCDNGEQYQVGDDNVHSATNSNSSSDLDLTNQSAIAMLQLRKLGVSVKKVPATKNYIVTDSSDSDKSTVSLSQAKTLGQIHKDQLKLMKTTILTMSPNAATIGLKRRSTRLISTVASLKTSADVLPFTVKSTLRRRDSVGNIGLITGSELLKNIVSDSTKLKKVNKILSDTKSESEIVPPKSKTLASANSLKMDKQKIQLQSNVETTAHTDSITESHTEMLSFIVDNKKLDDIKSDANPKEIDHISSKMCATIETSMTAPTANPIKEDADLPLEYSDNFELTVMKDENMKTYSKRKDKSGIGKKLECVSMKTETPTKSVTNEKTEMSDVADVKQNVDTIERHTTIGDHSQNINDDENHRKSKCDTNKTISPNVSNNVDTILTEQQMAIKLLRQLEQDGKCKNKSAKLSNRSMVSEVVNVPESKTKPSKEQQTDGVGVVEETNQIEDTNPINNPTSSTSCASLRMSVEIIDDDPLIEELTNLQCDTESPKKLRAPIVESEATKDTVTSQTHEKEPNQCPKVTQKIAIELSEDLNVDKTKAHRSKARDSDAKRYDKRSPSSSSSKSHHTKSSKQTESDRNTSSASNKKISSSKKPTDTLRDKHTSPATTSDSKSVTSKEKQKKVFKGSTGDGKSSSATTLTKPKDAYSILSECYLPKMVKHDESLYSIEAFKAAQAQAIADAKAQAEASAKARAEAAARAAAAAAKAREDAIARAREEVAAKAREEAAAAKAREDEEKAKALAAANRARERAAAKQRALEAAKAREAAVKEAVAAKEAAAKEVAAKEAADRAAALEAEKLVAEDIQRKIEIEYKQRMETECEVTNEPMVDDESIQRTENRREIVVKSESTDNQPEIIDENFFLTEYKTESNSTNNEATITDIKTEDHQDGESIEEETTIRRSGRLRTKTESNKQREHGFGLVRDRERYLPYTAVSSSVDHGYGSLLSESSSYSGSLTDINSSGLADIKEEPYVMPVKSAAELEQEFRNISEGLALFEQMSENEYKCERIISKESKKMQCDCFLTKSEIERGELGCGEDCLNRLLMIECGNRCVVGDRCTNKRFQKIMNANCTIFKAGKKGFGMKAASIIPEGEFIMEYVGEVLNSEQFEEKVETYSQDKNIHHYFMALRNDCIIDATIRGNISRFINHSCDPNAETQKWTVNGELRVGFFSRRTIYPDQEITFDYKFRRYGKEAQKCYCDAANCRGWIGEEPDSDDEYEVDDEDEDDEEDESTKAVEDVVVEVKTELPLIDSLTPESEAALPIAVVPAIPIDDQSRDIEMTQSDPMSAEVAISKKPTVELPPQIVAEPIVVRPSKVPKIKRDKSKARHKLTNISEDQDLDMEISILTQSNLKNQSHTLRFSRLMVRAKQQRAKSQLLYLLRNGELACRRLFLDYHGLKLLYAWMCDRISKDMKVEWEFRLEILKTLEVLPIPHKTMLKESKILATIEKWSQITDLKDCQLEQKSPDESPVETVIDDVDSPSSQNAELVKDIRCISSKLLTSWEVLKEVFRIPKKLRIEQMKEHEREADLSYQALGLQTDVIAADEEEQRRKRFRRGLGREVWEKDYKFWDKDRANRNKDTKENSEWNMLKMQRRQQFEQQVGVQDTTVADQKKIEEDSMHAAKCSFFRLDPRHTNRKNIPFRVNPITGQWYTEDNRAISTPPSHSHIKPPPQPKSTNPSDYILPTMDLPEYWKYAIDDQGRLYFYHTKIRIPQWEPPIKLLPLFAENKEIESMEESIVSKPNEDDQAELEAIHAIRIDCGASNDDIEKFSSDSETDSSEDELSDMLNSLTKTLTEQQLRVDDMLGRPMQSLSDEISALAKDQVMSPTAVSGTFAVLPSFSLGIENKGELGARCEALILKHRKRRRRIGLVSERIISPRTDEERIELKMEMRRYRENKEKLKRRKEEAKRRRQLTTISSHETPKKYSKLVDGLPPLVYDEDDDSTDDEEPFPNVGSSEMSRSTETVVAADEPAPFRFVDELDALKPSDTVKIISKNYKLDAKPTNQKHTKSSSKTPSAASTTHVNSEDAKRIKDKFRAEIAGVIVQHLSPYRKENCQIGRITNNDDFKHLAKKLTHFVMLKELKHCDNTINVLVVTDSVKQKSKEFIRKYMAKFGSVYTKPDNEPEYKDFNNSQ